MFDDPVGRGVAAFLLPPRGLASRFRVKHPRWEPYAGIPPVRI